MLSKAILVNIKEAQQGLAGHIRYWVVQVGQPRLQIPPQGPECTSFLRSAMGWNQQFDIYEILIQHLMTNGI